MCEAGASATICVLTWADESTILFVGFQAGRLTGRTILDGANRVRIWGRDVAVGPDSLDRYLLAMLTSRTAREMDQGAGADRRQPFFLSR